MSSRVKYETWLSPDDHAAAEAERLAQGIRGRAEFLRATLRAGKLTRDADMATALGWIGRATTELEIAATRGETLTPELEILRRQAPDLLLLLCRA